MQYACAILSYVELQYFFRIISYTARFPKEKKVTEHEIFVLISLQICLKQFPFYEELSEIWLQMYIGLHVKYTFYLSDFSELHPVASELLRADTRTDMTKLRHFSHFCERAQKPLRT